MPAAQVLYIEDNDADFYLMQIGLERCMDSLDLRRASDGAEASALVKRFRNEDQPDLILLDINLPGTDGFSVLRFLKSQPLTRDIPVIVFTSSSRGLDQEQALAHGAQEFITKPQTLTHMWTWFAPNTS